MDTIYCVRDTGELLPDLSGRVYGNLGRPDDTIQGRGGQPLRIVFADVDRRTPVLLPSGSALFFDCKPPAKYDRTNFVLSVTITQEPASAADGYVGHLATNTPEANALLSPNNQDGTTPDADEPDQVPLMAQLCWQPTGNPLPDPGRSLQWTIQLENTVRHGNEGMAASPNRPYPQPEAVGNAVAQAATLDRYSFRDLPGEAVSVVDGAIAGQVPAFASLQGAGAGNLFSAWNNATHLFVRNPACAFAGLDLSCVSVANSANADGTGGNRGCVTMVTRRHGLTNHHFLQPRSPGVRHWFVGTDGQTLFADVVSSTPLGGGDGELVTFDRDLPAAVVPARLLSPAVLGGLPPGTPLLATNQQKQAVVRELVSAGAGTVTTRPAQGAGRPAWTANVVVGDSDAPSFVAVGGRLALLTTYYTATSGPDYSALLAAIAALLPAGYALDVASFPVLGSAASRQVGTGPGNVPALDVNGQLPASAIPPGTGGGGSGSAPVEQLWDGQADVTVSAAATVLRLTNPALGGDRRVTLPSNPANAATLTVVLPGLTGGRVTMSADLGNGGFLNLAIADPRNCPFTAFFYLVAGGGTWRIDYTLARQFGDPIFRTLSLEGIVGDTPAWRLPESDDGAPDDTQSFRWLNTQDDPLGGYATTATVAVHGHELGGGYSRLARLHAGQAVRATADGASLEGFDPARIVFPDADPHLAGAGYWHNGVLTRSNG